MFVTLAFSVGFGSVLLTVYNKAFNEGYMRPFQEACVASCGFRDSEVTHVRPMQAASLRERELPVYECLCQDGKVLVPVPSRLYINWSSTFSDDSSTVEP